MSVGESDIDSKIYTSRPLRSHSSRQNRCHMLPSLALFTTPPPRPTPAKQLQISNTCHYLQIFFQTERRKDGQGTIILSLALICSSTLAPAFINHWVQTPINCQWENCVFGLGLFWYNFGNPPVSSQRILVLEMTNEPVYVPTEKKNRILGTILSYDFFSTVSVLRFSPG